MRGLVIVALGAILIWIGLSTGGGSTDASGVEGPPPGTEAAPSEGETSSDSLEFDRVDDRTLASVVDGGALDPEAERPIEQAPPAPTPEPAAVEPKVDPPAPVFHAPASVQQVPGLGDDLGFDQGGSDPIRLATILLEAWISGDTLDLRTYMTEGKGVELPAARQQLVGGFWEALLGKEESAAQRFDSIRGKEGVTSAQLALLAAAIDPPGQRAVPRVASSGRVEPLALAMRMILLGDEAQSLLEVRDYGRAAVAWSDLLQLEIGAPWPPHREAIKEWGRTLAQAQANHRFAKSGNWPSVDVAVKSGDSLTVIRKRVLRNRSDLVICTGLIEATNGLGRYIQAGDILRIPTDRVNAIVDLDARTVLYRHGDEVVQVWECGIGMDGHETPLGVFTIGEKLEEPAHSTENLPYGDPRNPLGSRWLALLRDGTNTSYGFHGTSDPSGVGGAVSLGCVRMRNEDVNELFEIMPKGAEVVIQR